MEILNQFGVQPILLLGQIVNFLLLLFILKKVFFKPLLNHLEKRQKIIEDGIKNAENAEKIIQKAQAAYDKKIVEAKAEFNQILEDAKNKANQIVAEAQEKAQKNVDAMLLEAKEKIDEDRVKLHNEVKKDMVSLIGIAVERVTRGLITKKQSQDYTIKTLSDLKQYEQKSS